jgi:hypothetical protein
MARIFFNGTKVELKRQNRNEFDQSVSPINELFDWKHFLRDGLSVNKKARIIAGNLLLVKSLHFV